MDTVSPAESERLLAGMAGVSVRKSPAFVKVYSV